MSAGSKKPKKECQGSDVLSSPDESGVHMATQVAIERFITTMAFFQSGVREARTLDLRITLSYETYALANCATTPLLD